MTLKNISTRDLVDELTSRGGVEKVVTGSYQKYELIKKYSNDRSSTIAATVLIIKHQDLFGS